MICKSLGTVYTVRFLQKREFFFKETEWYNKYRKKDYLVLKLSKKEVLYGFNKPLPDD